MIDRSLLTAAASLHKKLYRSTGATPRLWPLYVGVIQGGLGLAAGAATASNLEPFWVIFGSAMIILGFYIADQNLQVLKIAPRVWNARTYKAAALNAALNVDKTFTMRIAMLATGGTLGLVSTLGFLSGDAHQGLYQACLASMNATGALKYYLEAAEPPMPDDGDHFAKVVPAQA